MDVQHPFSDDDFLAKVDRTRLVLSFFICDIDYYASGGFNTEISVSRNGDALVNTNWQQYRNNES